MPYPKTLAAVLLALLVTACASGVQTRPGDTTSFEQANYQFYRWRSQPLDNSSNSLDPVYVLDPILRREVDTALQDKGYVLDPERAQFSVDYIFAPGLIMGEKSADATNIQTYPTVIPNRQVNQAVVDNAYALGGVKETSNIGLQFNDIARNEEVWRVVITKIVEDVNEVDPERIERNAHEAVTRGLRTLPPAQ